MKLLEKALKTQGRLLLEHIIVNIGVLILSLKFVAYSALEQVGKKVIGFNK